jgi:2-isopropylmalate synthase
LCEHSDGEEQWGTVGVHANIIDASWKAVVDGLVIGLLRDAERASR